MCEEMKHKFRHGDMRGMYMHGDMKKGMMMKYLKRYLSDEDMKKIAVKKMDMKIVQAEQKLELLNMMRDMIKNSELKKD